MRGFLTLENLNSFQEEMNHLKNLKRINNNAYQVDMPQEFGEAPPLMSNSLQEGEDDTYMGDHTQRPQEVVNQEVILALEGPKTRGRLKRIQEEEKMKGGALTAKYKFGITCSKALVCAVL
ncbi:hypothetical protein CR513_16219, partial [Mucuna pruriens]